MLFIPFALLLSLVEQKLLVVGEVFLAAVAGDEAHAILADGQLHDGDDQLLPLLKDVLAGFEHV